MPEPIARPIHYLGSKLRVIDAICEAVDSADLGGRGVCDLFAGSGTVALALAKTRSVTAVDIQEYSRVLCSALLSDFRPTDALVQTILSKTRTSAHHDELCYVMEPLIKYEDDCLHAAAANDPEPLCDLIEQGSVFSFQMDQRDVLSRPIEAALQLVKARLNKVHNTKLDALVSRHFGGLFFSYRQAVQIDSILSAHAEVPADHHDMFTAALLSTASDTVNTVGKQFAQPIRPRTRSGVAKRHLIKQIQRDRSTDVFDAYEDWLSRYLAMPVLGQRSHRVVRGDYREFLARGIAKEVGVVYADPPYTRDHYSRYYHVLETICLQDDPSVSTNKAHGRERLSRGMYRAERHQSPFCIVSQAPTAFAELFGKVRQMGLPVVLSYSPYVSGNGSRPRAMTLERLVALARQDFGRVAVAPAGHVAHNKLNTAARNMPISYEAEVLIVCRP
ncbi:MAG: DNA adenine methylase [Chloroflexota bacterium]|nr:DNA adenine methylase [Chloroflexota bacterium]